MRMAVFIVFSCGNNGNLRRNRLDEFLRIGIFAAVVPYFQDIGCQLAITFNQFSLNGLRSVAGE